MNRRDFLVKGGGLAAVSLVGGRLLREALMPNVSVAGSLDPQNVRTFAGCVGIRGVWGPQTSSGLIPGYPGSFNATIGSGGTYATIAAAIAAEGNNSIMQLLAGVHTLSAAVNPKQGQQFWGHPGGATVTGSTSIHGFHDGEATTRPDVKIKNITFTGLNNPVRDNVSINWEIAYCDFSGCANAPVFAFNNTGPPWIHHNKFHDLPQGPGGRSTNPFVIEDNEISRLSSSEGWKAATRYANMVIRHNWVHDNNVGAQVGIWLDTGAVDQEPDFALIEWNLVEGSPYGIVLEADFGGSIVRNNLVRNCLYSGIKLQATDGAEVYGNELTGNLTAGLGSPTLAELAMYVEGGDIGLASRGKCTNNNFHHNDVTLVGASPRWASAFQFSDPGQLVDKTDWANNAKNNDWDFNTYHLGSRLAASAFVWPAADGTGVAKTFAQWQAIPQDVNGSAVA
jgi:parallel beta-helix repeat protein